MEKWHKIKFGIYEPNVVKKISILMKTSGFVMQYFVFFYMFLYLECNYLCFYPPPLSTVFVMFNKINYFSGVAQGINFLYRKGGGAGEAYFICLKSIIYAEGKNLN